jgi:hypothetical protein
VSRGIRALSRRFAPFSFLHTAIAHDPTELITYLLTQQTTLNATGAGIGSVVVQLNDLVSGAPLLVYGGDATWGQNFTWISPSIKAYVDDKASASQQDAVQNAPTDAQNTAGGVAATATGAVP